MSILVFGHSGQVATALRGYGDVIALGRDQADLSDPEACAAAIAQHAPCAVINAAAYTAVDAAEENEAAATVINGAAPGAMARACAARGIPFVHISTDYVFDGSGSQPWCPEDATGPVSAYGRSKLAGEEAVRAAGGISVILRTSWVFSETGTNFVKTMLRLGAERDVLNVVADQIGGPTAAADIAATCIAVVEGLISDPARAGTYHYSGAPDVSWAEFARSIMAQAGLATQVTDIPTSAYPTPATRPLNSRLDCRDLETHFGLARPTWRASLATVFNKLQDQSDE
jgi:dTDP-4-dehydrorhamnose reductase